MSVVWQLEDLTDKTTSPSTKQTVKEAIDSLWSFAACAGVAALRLHINDIGGFITSKGQQFGFSYALKVLLIHAHVAFSAAVLFSHIETHVQEGKPIPRHLARTLRIMEPSLFHAFLSPTSRSLVISRLRSWLGANCSILGPTCKQPGIYFNYTIGSKAGHYIGHSCSSRESMPHAAGVVIRLWEHLKVLYLIRPLPKRYQPLNRTKPSGVVAMLTSSSKSEAVSLKLERILILHEQPNMNDQLERGLLEKAPDKGPRRRPPKWHRCPRTTVACLYEHLTDKQLTATSDTDTCFIEHTCMMRRLSFEGRYNVTSKLWQIQSETPNFGPISIWHSVWLLSSFLALPLNKEHKNDFPKLPRSFSVIPILLYVGVHASRLLPNPGAVARCKRRIEHYLRYLKVPKCGLRPLSVPGQFAQQYLKVL